MSTIPKEHPLSPYGRIGAWDAIDRHDAITNAAGTVAIARTNPLNGGNDEPESKTKDNRDDPHNVNGNARPSPPLILCNNTAISQSGGDPLELARLDTHRSSSSVNYAIRAVGPPSKSSLASPGTSEQVTETPSTSKSKLDNSMQNDSLHAPVPRPGNRSQGLLISDGGDGSSSTQESSGKRRLSGVYDFFTRKKSPFEKPSSQVKGENPEIPKTDSLSTVHRPKSQSKFTDRARLDIDDFSNLDHPCPKTWGELVNLLAPLVTFAPIIDFLQNIFDVADVIKTNKAHWRGLRNQCVFTSLVVAFQYQRYQNDEEKRKFVVDVCKNVAQTIREVELSARKWSNKSLIVAFAQFEKMGDDIALNIERLNASQRALETSSRVLSEALSVEMVEAQKSESEEIRLLHGTVNQQTDALNQLKQQLELNERRSKEFEKHVRDALQQHMLNLNKSQGDAQDIEKTIGIIVSLTGVQLPAEVFYKKVCTNVSLEPISRAPTCAVYKAKLAGGQLVAKKVFEIGKYSEGDVKTYAEKMCRDVQEWRKFDSEYTLQCFGIGMERFGDGAFKMYMVSPLVEHMDAMSYLKSRRGLINGQVTLHIEKRDILRIVEGAALGLVEVHRHHSVHSNMRGDNVLVRSDGMGILGGFGLTKSLQNHETGRLASIEQTGQNPPYRWMAPECVNPEKGKPDVTQANDVWGWAMTTLQIITGVLPIYWVKNDMFLFADDARSHFIPKRDRYSEFEVFAHQPDALWTLLEQCWDRHPHNRPPMEEVARQLTQVISLP